MRPNNSAARFIQVRRPFSNPGVPQRTVIINESINSNIDDDGSNNKETQADLPEYVLRLNDTPLAAIALESERTPRDAPRDTPRDTPRDELAR